MSAAQSGAKEVWKSAGEGIRVQLRPNLPVLEVLTPGALEFLATIQREFAPEREAILARRVRRQHDLDAGKFPTFLAETVDIREADWKVASAPADLNDRRVEITGPAEAKMMINALNSGARVFMADMEDSLSPAWENVIQGQVFLQQAVRRELSHRSPEGKSYRLADKTATLVLRPRGWHLSERHVEIDGKPVSGSLFDFCIYFFHNAQELIRRGSGPYFYLAKLESHVEARLWNNVFNRAQDLLGIPRGTIRATVLIETILAAFEMDEILFELRNHGAGLNAGRWDYIFSAIKKFRAHPEFILPDRSQVTMTVPFMRAYTELIVKTCHRRGAHAIGGMSAFIPSRKNAEVNDLALSKVREDKLRESRDGFDGTWVAHPDLVPLATGIFDEVLLARPHQKDRLREEVTVTERQLIELKVPDAQFTEAGLRANINVALEYLHNWLSGTGAAAINNLMEDVATAEISRAQIWQWIRHRVRLSDGRTVTPDLYRQIRSEELARHGGPHTGHYGQAVAILDSLVLQPEFTEFLTLPAYQHLD